MQIEQFMLQEIQDVFDKYKNDDFDFEIKVNPQNILVNLYS